MRSRKALVVAVAILSLVAVPGVVYHQGIWLAVTTKRISYSEYLEHGFRSRPVRGWVHVKRWTDQPVAHGPRVLYWERTGFKFLEMECIDGEVARSTCWSSTGTVLAQRHYLDKSGTMTRRDGPPWWWGVTDQTEPTAPWWPDNNGNPVTDQND